MCLWPWPGMTLMLKITLSDFVATGHIHVYYFTNTPFCPNIIERMYNFINQAWQAKRMKASWSCPPWHVHVRKVWVTLTSRFLKLSVVRRDCDIEWHVYYGALCTAITCCRRQLQWVTGGIQKTKYIISVVFWSPMSVLLSVCLSVCLSTFCLLVVNFI